LKLDGNSTPDSGVICYMFACWALRVYRVVGDVGMVMALNTIKVCRSVSQSVL